MPATLTKNQIIGISVGSVAAVALGLGLGLSLGLKKDDETGQQGDEEEEQETTATSTLTWSCDPSSANPNKCVQVQGQGQYATKAECKCWACDASSTDPTRCSPVSAGSKGTAAIQDACMCVYAVGAAGPNCECTYNAATEAKVGSGSAGKPFHDVSTCKGDATAKCGWTYAPVTYGTIVQCADMNGQYYIVDEATQSLRLLTETTGPTYDANYKTHALYTNCAYYGYTVGEPAPPRTMA